jgi:hypothetical protein
MFKVNLTFTITPPILNGLLVFFCLTSVANALPNQEFCYGDKVEPGNSFVQDELEGVDSLATQPNEVRSLSGNEENVGIKP